MHIFILLNFSGGGGKPVRPEILALWGQRPCLEEHMHTPHLTSPLPEKEAKQDLVLLSSGWLLVCSNALHKGRGHPQLRQRQPSQPPSTPHWLFHHNFITHCERHTTAPLYSQEDRSSESKVTALLGNNNQAQALPP